MFAALMFLAGLAMIIVGSIFAVGVCVVLYIVGRLVFYEWPKQLFSKTE